MVLSVIDVQELEKPLDVVPRVRFAVKGKRQQHILNYRQRGDEVEILEYISENPASDLRKLSLRQRTPRIAEDTYAAQNKLPGRRIVETAQEINKGGFARP